ncbi:SDR family NAD(P)-dependent oxidoreductase [Subtercola boreus]|nr:SDR family oxidoreductase [Subtercola boreus]
MSKFSLAGRRALVTGGNRGLGFEQVVALHEAGAQVVFVSRDADANADALRALGSADGVTALTGDITQPGEPDRIVSEAVERMGGLDILVNNAGACVHNPSVAVTDDDWDLVMNLNVKALFKMCVAAFPHLSASDAPAIVNIGSMSGIIVNRPQWQPAYNASKAAVHHLTRSLAAEWAPSHIRVNAVAPGYVATDMTPLHRPEFKRYWVDDAPMTRAASADEISPSVVFLSSAAASFITGSILVVDGGYSVY